MAALAEDLLPEDLLPDEPATDSAALLRAAAAYAAAADAAEAARLAAAGEGSDAENAEPAPSAPAASAAKPRAAARLPAPASVVPAPAPVVSAPAASAARGTASRVGNSAPASPPAAPPAALVPAASGGNGEPAGTEQPPAAEDTAEDTAEPPAKKARTTRAPNPTFLDLPPALLDSAAAGAGSRQLLLGLARPELLTGIFSLLGPFQSYSTLSLVNKHWRVVLQTPEIWTDLSYEGARKGQATWLPNCRTYYQFIALLKHPRFRQLKSLCLPTGMKLGKKNITYIARECPHLTYLNISNASGCKVLQLQQIAECWPNLTTFIMGEPTVGGIDHTEGFLAIVNTCTRLQRLELHSWYLTKLRDEVLQAIGQLRHLEYLLLSQGTYPSCNIRLNSNEALLSLVALGPESRLRMITLKNLGTRAGQQQLRAACAPCPLLRLVVIV